MPEYKNDPIFSYIDISPWATILMSVFLMSLLALPKMQGIEQAPDPYTTFILGYFFLFNVATVGVNGARNVLTATGLRAPIRGLSWTLGVSGIGIATMTYSFFNKAASILPQTPVTASILNPFYNPYSSIGTAFALLSDPQFLLVIVHQFGLIALFEEIYKVILIKNMANYFHVKRGWSQTNSLGAALVLILSVWSTWHFVASWKPSISAIFSGILIGIIFYLSWIIAEFAGVLTEKGKLFLTAFLTIPSVLAHGTWNTLDSLSLAGIEFMTLFTMGLGLAILGMLASWIISKRYETPSIT